MEKEILLLLHFHIAFSSRSEVLIQLSELCFRSCSFISNQSISKYLSCYDLIEIIDLRDCCQVNYKILQLITNHFPRLTTLYVGQTESKLDRNSPSIDFFGKNSLDRKYFLAKPKLKFLSMEGIGTIRDETIEDIFYKSLTQSSEQIRVLDLSRNSALESLGYIDCFKQIHSLILYDIYPTVIEAAMDSLCTLNTLVLLDLSLNRRAQDSSNYSKPTIVLAKLIRSLPKLLSLDISGTNLAGAYSFVEEEELAYIRKELSIRDEEYVFKITNYSMYWNYDLFPCRTFNIRSSIAGLLVLQHELEFLGLFDVEESGSARQWLPAKKVNNRGLVESIYPAI